MVRRLVTVTETQLSDKKFRSGMDSYKSGILVSAGAWVRFLFRQGRAVCMFYFKKSLKAEAIQN